MAVKYPDLTKEYCECSTAKIQEEFTQAEYIEITKIGIEEERAKVISSISKLLVGLPK